MLFLISNTNFGYKNNNKEILNSMLDYFERVFIPFLEKYSKEGDSVVHLGNLFCSSQSINIKVLNKVQSIFERISEIYTVHLLVGFNDKYLESKTNDINTLKIFKNFKNINIVEKPTLLNNDTILIPWSKNIIKDLDTKEKIIIFNYDYLNNDKEIIKETLKGKKVYCGYYNNKRVDDNITIIGSPYQIGFDDILEKGFFSIDLEKDKELFVENKTSPRFEKLELKTLDDIKNIDKEFVDKNYVDVILGENLMKENKIKLDILLSKYKFNNIKYEKTEEVLDLKTTDFNINKILIEYIENIDNPLLIEEFNNILEIHKKKS